jgi:hypothetical protein
MVNSERVIVACVAENREPFLREVAYLFKSLRQFGGNLAQARCIAYFVGSADFAATESLAELGVSVKIVEPLDSRCPHANKIRMLDDTEDSDYLVALDIDTVVARDFSAYIQGSAIAAKPAGQSRLTVRQWEALFRYFELDIPLARYMTTATMRETIPYFNTGVVIAPKQHVSCLRETWGSFVARLLMAHNDLPELAEVRPVFYDQFALALALASGRLPYRALPLEMNFPTDRQVNAALEPERLAPYILHHHHRLSEAGDVLPCPYENVNTMIERINASFRSWTTEVAKRHRTGTE